MTMRILCVGVNHKTAPVSLRERLVFSPAAAAAAMQTLRDRYGDAQFVIVSTCNRSEVYVARPVHGHPRAEQVRAAFGEFQSLPPEQYDGALYVRTDADAVEHLFNVAAGLDSLVPGEEQIASQLKKAYRLAADVGATGSGLNELFQLAFNVAKHVRTGTRIAAGKVSVASVALELARETFADLSGKCVLGVGAGKMNSLMLKGLRRAGAGAILVANRSAERAAELADECGGEVTAFEKLPEALAAADLVLCSTAADEPILTVSMVRSALDGRAGREMLIIDIAVPRDVHPDVASLEGVRLFNIDDLTAVVEKNIHRRNGEIDACREIIARHVAEYFHSLHVREVAPTIEALYLRLRAIGDEELAAVKNKLTGDADADEKLLRGAFHRALRRALHVPITQLRAGAGTEVARQQAATLRKLFDLPLDEG